MAQIPSLVDLCAVKYCESFDSKQHLLQNTVSLPRKITDILTNVHTSNCITVRTESYLQSGEEYCKECWRNTFTHGVFRDFRCLYTRPSVDRRIYTQKGVWEQMRSKFICKSCNNPFKTTVRCMCCCDYRFDCRVPPIGVIDRGIVPPLANLSGAKYCEQFEMGEALISHLRQYHTYEIESKLEEIHRENCRTITAVYHFNQGAMYCIKCWYNLSSGKNPNVKVDMGGRPRHLDTTM
ncbi:hypothetical protein J6590_081866 [Homalodisca vitripennis]|nr:hypothetical protein J6590_081866 [Homalodisca vitripennis]